MAAARTVAQKRARRNAGRQGGRGDLWKATGAVDRSWSARRDRPTCGERGSRLTNGFLADARALLGRDPAAAVVAARQAVAAAATDAARLALGAALRRTGALDAALAELVPLATRLPRAWGVHYELGMAHAGLGQNAMALPALVTAAALNPRSSLVGHALGGVRLLLGETAGGAPPPDPDDPRLAAAALAWLAQGDAAPLAGLGLHVSDIAAVSLIAAAGVRQGAADAVVAMLTRALAVTPAYAPARLALALALADLDRYDDALAAIDRVVAVAPVAAVRAVRATIQMQRGAVAAAIDDYSVAAGTDPAIWHSLGHALRAAGRADAAVAAYRRALALRPGYAEVYWSLANLKTWRFAPGDRTAMTGLLGTATGDDRAWLHFALGKAAADAGDDAASFTRYAAGNAVRRMTTRYDRAAHEDFVARTIATFTAEFFAARTGWGDPARDPVFVVGLPRSGSTLVEQILASHPDVDGLSELPDLPRIAANLGGRYPDALTDLTAADFVAAGRAYLDRTRPRRTPGRGRFTDKLPANFLHAGLIHLMLPNATIIDVRRDPVATCFSLFRQLFARGQAYSYDLADLGHYYRCYLAVMDHFAAVLPGRVVTISYEALIDDADGATRRLLAAAGLAFDPACLRFFASDRPVRTASSEQVRQPIHRGGLDDWRRFDRWLGPLRAALAPGPDSMPILNSPIR